MDDPEKDRYVIDFRPRFTPSDAVKILSVAAEMGLPPNVLIRLWVKKALKELEAV